MMNTDDESGREPNLASEQGDKVAELNLHKNSSSPDKKTYIDGTSKELSPDHHQYNINDLFGTRPSTATDSPISGIEIRIDSLQVPGSPTQDPSLVGNSLETIGNSKNGEDSAGQPTLVHELLPVASASSLNNCVQNDPPREGVAVEDPMEQDHPAQLLKNLNSPAQEDAFEDQPSQESMSTSPALMTERVISMETRTHDAQSSSIRSFFNTFEKTDNTSSRITPTQGASSQIYIAPNSSVSPALPTNHETLPATESLSDINNIVSTGLDESDNAIFDEKLSNTKLVHNLQPVPTDYGILLPTDHRPRPDADKKGTAEDEVAPEASGLVGASLQEKNGDRTSEVDAEFELDSSPLQSSSSSISTDSSSSGESDDEEYELLDPTEQALRLMQEDGGSDDDSKSGPRGPSGPPRTLNEKPDEVVPKPNVTITNDMKVEELGAVENLVENIVLVKAKTSGEYQVLEFGSVLCLADKTVIGVVAETLGRVQQPYYSVRFTNAAAISEAGISKGTPIFYVEQHSAPVFTQPLKAFKGSDASNLHDEEVGDDAIEFSDDEAEAEYKKKLKLTNKAKRDIRQGPRDGFSRALPHGANQHRQRSGDHALGRNGNSAINYDDHESGEELYTPLARPSNLHEIMGPREAPVEDQNVHYRTDRGNRGGRGRGERGRRRGDRGGGPRAHEGGRIGFNTHSHNRHDRRHVNREPDANFDQQLEGRDFHPPAYESLHTPGFPPPQPSSPLFPPYSQPSAGSTVFPSAFQPPPPIITQNNHPNQNTDAYQQQPYAHSPSYPAQPPTYSSQPPAYPAQPQSPYHPFNYQHHQNPPQRFLPTNPHHHHTLPTAYPSYQPQPPPPAAIPPGTFINPAFFPTTAQNPFTPQPLPWPQPPSSSSSNNNGNNGLLTAEPGTAFHAAQEKLHVLRNLSRGAGSPPL